MFDPCGRQTRYDVVSAHGATTFERAAPGDHVDVGSDGLWLRETEGADAIVLHAASVRQESGVLQLKEVSIFRTNIETKRARRIEAESGELRDRAITLVNASGYRVPEETPLNSTPIFCCRPR